MPLVFKALKNIKIIGKWCIIDTRLFLSWTANNHVSQHSRCVCVSSNNGKLKITLQTLPSNDDGQAHGRQASAGEGTGGHLSCSSTAEQISTSLTGLKHLLITSELLQTFLSWLMIANSWAFRPHAHGVLLNRLQLGMLPGWVLAVWFEASEPTGWLISPITTCLCGMEPLMLATVCGARVEVT